ncbi:Protein of unknown function [Gryllus bimaculatus]|nr:Protein of unknown function [Gryllus bimaculatus]
MALLEAVEEASLPAAPGLLTQGVVHPHLPQPSDGKPLDSWRSDAGTTQTPAHPDCGVCVCIEREREREREGISCTIPP